MILGWSIIVAGWIPLAVGLMLGNVRAYDPVVAERNATICFSLWILSMLAGGPFVLYGRLSEYWNRR